MMRDVKTQRMSIKPRGAVVIARNHEMRKSRARAGNGRQPVFFRFLGEVRAAAHHTNPVPGMDTSGSRSSLCFASRNSTTMESGPIRFLRYIDKKSSQNMVNLVEQMRSIMDLKHNIRSMSVIAHLGHGKTTLTDSLVQKAGIISGKAAGGARYTDTRADEAERGITVKSVGISMIFEYDMKAGVVSYLTDEEEAAIENTVAEKASYDNSNSYLINVVDSPGHVDFSSEVTAALRVTDGALVVADTVDGVGVQTETYLRQAISERVKPVLLINKVDRALLELQLPAEELYQAFCRAIESINVIAANYNDEVMGDVQVHPTKGTVAFGSGLHEWAFTLRHFAKIYSTKFNVPEEKMMEKLWGDWYFDDEKHVWNSDHGGNLERAFCQFIATPITTLFKAIMDEKHGKVKKMLEAIGVELKGEERDQVGKPLLKRVMQKWLPAGDTILEMIVLHLPSPAEAQKYRVNNLYTGPLDDKTATAIRNCDNSVSAPLCMYVSKMVPTTDKSGFYAFGRVFSGRIKTGQKVRIMGPDYTIGRKSELWIKNIQRVVIMMGCRVETVNDVPAGNTCGLIGVDQYLLKSGTICTEEDAHTIRKMKFVSPVVRCTVEPKNSADLPKLVEGMRRLAKSDPSVLCYTEELSGEHIIAASGELHLEICVQDFQNDFMGTEVKVSDPVVSFRETCTAKSKQTCLAKSANRHSRLWAEAEPLGPELCKAIDDGDIKAGADPKIQARKLADEFGWDVSEARKIWAFGPHGTGPNMFVDTTKGVQYLYENKEAVVGGFAWATHNGPLCEEQMRGCRFNLIDVVIVADAIHRGMGQLMPAARRVCFASMMAADPGILEPIYLCNISVPQDAMGNVYGVLTRRRGHVFTEEQRPGTPMMTLLAYLPVMESFGFTADLRSNTGGKAFPQCSFDHWEPISGSPYEDGTKCQEVVLSVRKRKGLAEGVPEETKYLDKF